MPATALQEPTLDVLSVLDANDEPVLANCSLSIGDVVLEFKNGRSRVPQNAAPAVARCKELTIPGYTGPVAEAPPGVSAALPAVEGDDPVEMAREHLREEGVEVPSALERVWVGDTAIDLPVEQARALLAKGHATSEQPGTKQAAQEVTLPVGFAELTDDGHPRCYARKGDGAQCTNAKVEGHACGLPAHKAQLDGTAG